MSKQNFSIFILTFLTGCSSFTLTDTFNYSKGFLFGYDSDSISIEDYNASQYSFANIKIGRGPASTVVLSYIDKQSYEWISADSISLFSSFGQIYKSEGLSFDFNYEPINVTDLSMHNKVFFTNVRFANPELINASVKNYIYSNGTVEISRLGQSLEVQEFFHEQEIPSIRWKKKNIYFVLDNKIISSIQHVHPNQSPFIIDYYYK